MRGDRRAHRTTLVGASALVAALFVLGETSASASSGPVVKESQYGFSFTLPAELEAGSPRRQ